jgi:hypothetical protein
MCLCPESPDSLQIQSARSRAGRYECEVHCCASSRLLGSLSDVPARRASDQLIVCEDSAAPVAHASVTQGPALQRSRLVPPPLWLWKQRACCAAGVCGNACHRAIPAISLRTTWLPVSSRPQCRGVCCKQQFGCAVQLVHHGGICCSGHPRALCTGTVTGTWGLCTVTSLGRRY